ncbi:ribosome biogenesis GTPase / thiamine phosphate phosphatase [Rhodocyclaceae bacterium]|nr:ribosome biogenesis GTPase / thiamine phosphate phosphatase [Rhodocyclaceae bacterium]
MSQAGTVVAAFGRQYEIALDGGGLALCFPRGKKSHVACGDRVTVALSAADHGVITAVLPRSTLLYRSDAFRQKLFAANATQAVIVVAAEPSFSDELVSRCIVAAEQQHMRALIVLNKTDLAEKAEAARLQLAPFRDLGYPVVELSAKRDAEALRPHLAGQCSVLVGQSGMGKSTLINALLPEVQASVREISGALDSGKHTTTHTRLYRLDAASSLIDSPGMQEFGLAHLTRAEIEQGFREFLPHLDRCRFRDCRHDQEPDCALRAAVAAGSISARRLGQFHALCASSKK